MGKAEHYGAAQCHMIGGKNPQANPIEIMNKYIKILTVYPTSCI